MVDDHDQKLFERYHDETLLPLLRERRFDELCRRITGLLSEATDEDFRFHLRADLATFRRYTADGESRSFKDMMALIEEFGDRPDAWQQLGGWYFYQGLPERPTREEMKEALKHFETALEKAHAKDEWVRLVLYDICRVLTAMSDYVSLEARMQEVVDDLSNTRRCDMPAIERDWVERIPDGAVDPQLLEVWDTLSRASYRRWRRLGEDSVTVPTLAELEAEPA